MDELKTPRQSIGRPMRRGWRAGQVAVEIAIVAPLLALVLVVCADFGRIFYATVEVDNAARAAAQYASQSTTTAGNTTNIQQAAANGSPGLSGLTVSSSQCTCGTPVGTQTSCSGSAYCADSTTGTNYVTVTATATYKTLLKYPGIPSSTVLTGTATMQVMDN